MTLFRDTYHKLISILFAIAFSVNFCMLLTLFAGNPSFSNSKWLSLGNTDTVEVIDILVSSKQIIVTDPVEWNFSFFKETFLQNQKAPFCLYKPQIKGERLFYPLPQICSHTGIFMCLRL
ncbi:MAG TPA: hypothetical protein DG754_11020 [Bacteroidales bacterium]|nr:hypothetical protein [Bacteroidales bacterium]